MVAFTRFHTSGSAGLSFLLVLAYVSLLNPAAFSCDVPVFSYALQHWASDPYRLYVFHTQPLPDEEQQLLDRLSEAARYEARQANLDIMTIDLADTRDSTLKDLYQAHLSDSDGGALLLYPESARIATPIYVGPLDVSLEKYMLHSPARNEIIERLIGGETSVFVLIESGNRRNDNQAEQLLAQELRRLERVLTLPDPDVWAPSQRTETEDEAPTIRFSIIRISRDAPEEALLRDMLLLSEPDLLERKDVPIVFPIYGRGLALYALLGDGINAWTIADACEFLTGPCSCEVKSQNPGTDLLLSVSWDKHIGPDRYASLPPPMGLSGFIERGEATALRLEQADATEAQHTAARDIAGADVTEASTRVSVGIVHMAGAVLALIILALVYWSFRRVIYSEGD